MFNKTEEWRKGLRFVKGDKIMYEDILYECIKTHKSEINPKEDNDNWDIVEDKEDNEEDDGDMDWGWIGVAFDMCNKDITNLSKVLKMKWLEVLHWITYQEYINKKEREYYEKNF